MYEILKHATIVTISAYSKLADQSTSEWIHEGFNNTDLYVIYESVEADTENETVDKRCSQKLVLGFSHTEKVVQTLTNTYGKGLI